MRLPIPATEFDHHDYAQHKAMYEYFGSSPKLGHYLRSNGVKIADHTLQKWRARLGIPICQESYRTRTGSTVEEAPDETKELISSEADRLQQEHLKREHRILTQEAARTQILVERLTEVVKPFPVVRVKPPIFKHGGVRTPMSEVVQLACWHFGEKVDPEQIMNLNAYDSEIAARRVYQLEKLILLALDIVGRAHPIPELRLMLLGDMVSGNIHAELAETNELDMFEQWWGLSLILGQFVQRLAPRYEKIIVEGVPGNHGRMTQKPTAKKRYVNWDFLAYHTLSLMLANQPNVECRFPKSIFDITEIQGHPVLMYHGDEIKSWGGIPFYGVVRAMAKLTELFQSVDQLFRYAAIAHFHTEADMPRARGKVLLTGSLKGTDEFSVGKMFTGSDPSQRIYFMHPEHGKTWELGNDPAHGDNTPHPYKLGYRDSLGEAWADASSDSS